MLVLRKQGKLESFCIPTTCKCIKFNVLPSRRVWVSPPPIIVSTTEGAFLFDQNNFIGLPTSQNFGAKSQKTIAKVTPTSHQLNWRQIILLLEDFPYRLITNKLHLIKLDMRQQKSKVSTKQFDYLHKTHLSSKLVSVKSSQTFTKKPASQYLAMTVNKTVKQ